MSFSVCSSGPLCDFPRLSAARLMLSRAFSSTVTFRGSSFYGFAASLCSSLRLFRFFAVTRQGFDALHRDFPWLVFLWLCRLFMFLTAAFPVLCRDSLGFSSPRYSSSQHSGALHTTLRFFASRLSETFVALQGFNRKLQKYNLNFIKLI